MITTTEVAAKTGLSAKTLARWAERGIIPKPAVRTHPNGRGKVGFWPDTVLDRCKRLQSLRKEGHDLDTAAAMLEMDRVNECIQAIEKPTLADLLENKTVRAGDREVRILDVFLSMVVSELKDAVIDRDLHAPIISGMRQDNLLRLAVTMIQNGYNPFLTFDGEKARVEPDFLLGHAYDKSGPSSRSLFLLPLTPIFRRLLDALGAGSCWRNPTVTPAPKVWVQEGDVMVEYTIYLGGLLGFELLRNTASVIGTTRTNSDAQDNE